MSLWFKLGGVALAAFAVWLGLTLFGNSRYHAGELTERVKWEQASKKGEIDKFAWYRAGVAQRQEAETVHETTQRTIIQPTLTKIIERSTQYAATPEGAAKCLSADRVGLLNDARAALFSGANPGAAGSRNGSVHSDAQGDGAGRFDDQRAGGAQPWAR